MSVWAACVALADKALPQCLATLSRASFSPSIEAWSATDELLEQKCTSVTQAFSTYSKWESSVCSSRERSLIKRFVMKCRRASHAVSRLTLRARWIVCMILMDCQHRRLSWMRIAYILNVFPVRTAELIMRKTASLSFSGRTGVCATRMLKYIN